jgi:hypothetical protein
MPPAPENKVYKNKKTGLKRKKTANSVDNVKLSSENRTLHPLSDC